MATLAPRQTTPFAGLADMRERFDQLFEELTDSRGAGRLPAMDIIAEDDALLIRAELPGLKVDEINVEVQDNVLTIRGQHEESKDDRDKRFIRRERRTASFARSISLPQGCDLENIAADHHDGVLEIRIPLAREEKARAIEVKASS
jgi:HSP20 family protein